MHTQRMLFILAASLGVIAVGSSGIAIAHPGGGSASHSGGGFHGAGGYRGSGGFHGGVAFGDAVVTAGVEVTAVGAGAAWDTVFCLRVCPGIPTRTGGMAHPTTTPMMPIINGTLMPMHMRPFSLRRDSPINCGRRRQKPMNCSPIPRQDNRASSKQPTARIVIAGRSPNPALIREWLLTHLWVQVHCQRQ